LRVNYEPQLVPQIAEFMLDRKISDRDARPKAYRVILKLLLRFLAQSDASSGEIERNSRHLKATITRRILEDSDLRPLARARLWPLCWKLDRGATLAVLAQSMAGRRSSSKMDTRT
jgi:hypothetical protein